VAAIQTTVEKDDLLTRLRIREVALFSLIALTAILANLPEDYGRKLGIDRDYLFAALGSAVVIGLFLYLRFFFFVAVVLLILGANLPDQIAQGFGISKLPLILALLAMIGVSLINTVVKLMPTGLEPKAREKSPEGVRALLYAVDKNNIAYGQRVLAMNFDPNLQHENGYTPLAYAALERQPADGRDAAAQRRRPGADDARGRDARRARAARGAQRGRRPAQAGAPGARNRTCGKSVSGVTILYK